MSGRNNQRITVDILGHQDDVEMEDSDSMDDESQVVSQAPLKRKLVDEFVRPSLDPPPQQHMKVYLRIRPFSTDELDRKENQLCLSVENEHTVSTHPPKDSHTYKNATRGLTKTMTKFTFSHIFNENTSQKEFFKDTMLGLVKDFIDGQNCLVFSYGVTSSGKTYTIQGNTSDAGILPRALDVLFNSISGQQWEPMNLKPKLFVGVQKLNAEGELRERKIKEKVLRMSQEDDTDVMSLLGDDASDISVATNTTTCSESSNISSRDLKESLESTDKLFAELDNRIREEARVNVQDQGNIKFSVWVSFAEIYNEQIYDLLEPVPKKKNARRQCLKLSEDRDGSPYIKGLKEIKVNSADEAYKLLTIGQRNLRTACTQLNHNSSRSHCIFNIKILRVVDKESPHVARVSMLSLCDLAGSERYTKSQTTGDRLKEAGNINTSLLTLGRCIETLKYNQQHKDHTRIVPFRESKLTRLFQNFFVGQGKAAMIVNVNQCASMFDETLHVFKFSAIASQVVTVQKPVFIKPKLPDMPASPHPIPRTSIMWATPARTAGLTSQSDAENVPLPEEDDDDDLEEKKYTQENIDELITIIDDLQNELSKEKLKAIKMEATIRGEIVHELKKQFIEIEEEYSEELRSREQLQEDLAERRIQLLVESKLSKKDKPEMMTDEDDEWVSSVLLHQEKVKVEERDAEIRTLKDKVAELESKIEGLVEGKEKLEKDKNNIAKQLEDSQKISDELQKELSAKNTSYMENLQEKLTAYEEKIEQLEQYLEKASEKQEPDDGKAALIENLTHQLTQSREQVKEQKKEIEELNEMLTEAGETFEQRETELQKLKDLVQNYEQRLESQSDAIKALEQAAADSRVAMETADQSLSKREECVSTLQAEIRELQGDTQKYQNKAKFFEEALAEREQEVLQWKQKYEHGKEEHLKSEEALIHGFTAEISNLKSQIFHFKTQLYGVKSPTKSSTSALKSPDVRSGQIFSPDSKQVSSTQKSQKQGFSHNVQEEITNLQSEMDKNAKNLSDLEHALHVSRSAIDELEKKLGTADEKRKIAESKVEELEVRLQLLGNTETKIGDISPDDLIRAKTKILDLENQLKENGEKLAQQSKIVLEIDSLNEQLDLKNKTIFDLENHQKRLEMQITELKHSVAEMTDQITKYQLKEEELEVLNSGLKEMINKTTADLELKERELHTLSPKSEDKKQCCDTLEAQEMETLQSDLKCKIKKIDALKEKVKKLKAGFSAEQILLKEANSKYSELEFRFDEKEIENHDLQKKTKELCEKNKNLEDGVNERDEELTKAGEELAFAKAEVEMLKRVNSEKEAEKLMKENVITELRGKIQDIEKEERTGTPSREDSSESKENECLKKSLEEKLKSICLLQDEVAKCKQRNKLTEEKLSEIDGFNEEILKLQNLLKGKEERIIELTDETRRLKEEITHLSSCVKHTDSLEKQVNEMKSSLIEKDEELAMLSDNLSALLDEKEIEDKHSEEKKRLKDKINDLEVQLQNSQNVTTKNGIDLPHNITSKSVDSVESQKALIDAQNKRIKDLEDKLNCLSEQVKEKENLELSFRDLESAVADKEMELCDKDKQVECKTAEVERLSARTAFLEMELKTKSEEVKKLQNVTDKKSLRIKELEENLQIVNQKLCDVTSSSEELRVSLTGCEEKCLNLEKVAKSLQDQLSEKLSYIEVCEKEMKISDSKVKCVLEKNNDLEVSLEAKSKELKDLKQSYNILKQQIDSNNIEQSKLADAMCEIAELKSAVHTHKTLHHNLKGELEEALLQLENKRSETNTLRKEQESNKQLENQLDLRDAELHEMKLKVKKLELTLEKKNETILNSEKIQKDLDEARHTIEELRNQMMSLRSVLQQDIQDIYGDCNEETTAVSEMKTEVHLLLEKNMRTAKQLGEENKSLKSELFNCKTCHEQAVNKLQKEIESLNLEKKQLIQKETILQTQKVTEIAEINCKKEKEIEKLTLSVDEQKSEIKELRNGLQNVETEKADLKNELEKLRNKMNRLLEVNGEKDDLEEKCVTLKTEIIDTRSLLKDERRKCLKTEEETKFEKFNESEFGQHKTFENDRNESLKILELQALYDSEKMKSEEYKNLLNEMKEQNCLSPHNGVRKLRMEKIEAENALIEAKFTIKSLEKKLKDKELNNDIKYSGLGSSHINSSTTESVLQQKLNKASSKLQDAESNNRSLIKEVTQLQGIVERLEKSLEEEKQKNGEKVEAETCQKTVVSIVQADPRQSISSPSTKVELSKSHEREHALREQLNKAKITIQEWSHKFTEIEKDLQQKTQELQDAKDKIASLERTKLEGSKQTDQELQKYLERIGELEREVIHKEEEVDSKAIMIDDLKQQLEMRLSSMKNIEQDVKSKDETIKLLKETLGEQDNMLQLQEEFMNKKEEEITSQKTEYQSLLDKYQTVLLTKDSSQHEHIEEAKNAARVEAERDLLRRQLEEVELKLQKATSGKESTSQTLQEVEHKLERALEDKERTSQQLKEVEHKLEKLEEEKGMYNKNLAELENKLHRALNEKAKTDRVLTENNQELKEMEKMLTEVRKDCEDLRAQGSDKHAETRLENLRHDLEKKIHDLQQKNKELNDELKDVKSKFHMTKETLKVAVEEKHSHEKTLKEFREERDKLVSGLEAILKKKDAEIRQYKEQIKQLKEKEEQFTQKWHEEREMIGSGLQQLEKNICKVKTEPVDEESTENNRTYRSPVRKGSYREAMTPLSPENNVPPNSHSRGKPPRPDPPKVQDNTESTSDSVFKSPVRRTNSRSRTTSETPVLANSSTSSTKQRGSSRRGKKRSPVDGDDDLPPIPPKRISTDTSVISESDDMSSHLQIDATPSVAAKTLRRTRKKNGSQLDLSAVEESQGSTRPARSSKKSARIRILESFRESPIAKGSRRILDNIAETFSPKSPTRSPTKDRDSSDCNKKSSSDSKENRITPSNLEVKEKKPSSRGRHKLYKEDTYISEPMEYKGEFVKSPDNVHKTVTRSLRSRRH